jgi:hypothetical protein
MRRSVVAVLALGFFGASCGGPPGNLTVNELPATVWLALGQDVHITSPDLVIRWLEIVDDTRCPVDVSCPQAGTVNMRFGAREAGSAESGFFLELGDSYSVFGVTIRVEDVTPERHSNLPVIPPKDYRVALGFTAP